MGELLYWLLNMSIVASLAGLVILLLRRIKRLPRRWIAALWAIPFLRFWLPFGIGGKYSLMSLLSRFATKTVVVYERGPVGVTMTNSIQAAETYFPITYRTDLLADVFRYAALVWAILAAALILAMTILYLTTLTELRTAEPLYGNVVCSGKVVSPAVYGILRPRIVLPASCRDSEQLDLILLHERRHIRRLDNLWRVLAFLTAALHWFNPLAWVFLKLYLSDVELACDESVLAGLPPDARGRYAHALLDTAQSKTLFASAFGGARLRTRIEHILSFKKMTVLSAAAFGIFAAGIAYILLVNGR